MQYGALAALFLTLGASSLLSQTITTGDIVGVVTDPTGAVVPNATVTLKSVESGETRTETTNGQGEYRFPLLKPGDYNVSASSSGLSSELTRVTILVGQEAAINLTMRTQATTTVIEITAETPILNTENANLETSMNSQQVQELPMPGGDLTTLAMTSQGIRVNVTGGSGNMNANGIIGSTILYTLNGTDENDPANNLNNSGASNNLLGANEVSEAAIVLDAYSPQYGRMAGAQVNLVGFSGTNSFHGNLFYNFNWEDLNANSFFNNSTGTPRGRSDAHNFGGRVGGPILKNKLFFFFDDENLRYVLPSAGVAALPSPQLQSYVETHVPAASQSLYQDYFNLISTAPGLNRAVPVANGTGPLQDGNNHLGCGTGTFTGTPTGTGGIFGVNTPCAVALGTNNTELNTEQLYTIRADYNLSNNNKLFFRFNHDFGLQATGTSPINPLYNSISNQPQFQGSVNDTYIITPKLVNNFVGSVLWYSALFGLSDFQKALATMPEAIAITDGGANGANTGTGGFTTVGGGAYPYGLPVGRNVGHIQFSDDLSWIKGQHTLKAGFAYRRDRYTYSSIAQNTDLGVYTLNDVADFANGMLNYSGTGLGSSFSQSYTPFGAFHFRVPSIDYYLSDEWAVRRNLKLTFGLRIEDNFNPTCVETCFVLTNAPFNSSSYSGGVSTPYNATLSDKQNLFYNSEGPIVEPRFGLAWKPFGEKTVIRGGIGLFATNYTDGLAGTLAAQVPNKFTPSGLTFGTIGSSTDPNSSAFSALTSANAFFSGFAAADTLAQIKTAVAPASFSVPSIASFPSTFHAPKVTQWSFEIQHELTSHNLFLVSYVGNHGYNLQETLNANMYTGSSGVSRYHGGYDGLPTAAPDPRFLSVTQYFNNGVSNYDSLTIGYQHRFAGGLTSQIHYTWSHALGDVSTSSSNSYYNPYNLAAAYGSLGFDIRHQIAGDLVWAQPYKTGNRITNSLIQGWTLATKLYIYSGAPFSVTDSKIPSQVNSAGGVITPLSDLLVPSQVNANCGGGVAVAGPCLVKADFATYSSTSGVSAPVQTDWGNIAPNSFRGPGYFDIDFTVTRDFRFKERYALQLGMQSYNLLNHPNFANPSGSISSGAFGTITSTLGPPTSIYGTGQGASVSGRLVVLTGKFSF
jgi:Carboxypeptidase regulatory-like domain